MPTSPFPGGCGRSPPAPPPACEPGAVAPDTALSVAEVFSDVAEKSLRSVVNIASTESIVAMLKSRERDTGLDLGLLAEISGYFGRIRRKYASFESGMFGVDVRVLRYQIPGGMLSNLVSQLREQGAEDDEHDDAAVAGSQ